MSINHDQMIEELKASAKSLANATLSSGWTRTELVNRAARVLDVLRVLDKDSQDAKPSN